MRKPRNLPQNPARLPNPPAWLVGLVIFLVGWGAWLLLVALTGEVGLLEAAVLSAVTTFGALYPVLDRVGKAKK